LLHALLVMLQSVVVPTVEQKVVFVSVNPLLLLTNTLLSDGKANVLMETLSVMLFVALWAMDTVVMIPVHTIVVKKDASQKQV